VSPTHRAPRRSLSLLSVLLLALSAGCASHVHRVGLGPTGIGSESARQY